MLFTFRRWLVAIAIIVIMIGCSISWVETCGGGGGGKGGKGGKCKMGGKGGKCGMGGKGCKMGGPEKKEKKTKSVMSTAMVVGLNRMLMKHHHREDDESPPRVRTRYVEVPVYRPMSESSPSDYTAPRAFRASSIPHGRESYNARPIYPNPYERPHYDPPHYTSRYPEFAAYPRYQLPPDERYLGLAYW